MVARVTLPLVSERLAKAYAETLVGKAGGSSGTRVLALRAQTKWQGPSSLTITVDEGSHTVLVRPCVSALAVHEALLDRGEDEFLVVLTDRSDSDLGLDILGRCFNQTVVSVDLWSAVLGLFGARTLDPRLKRLGWAQEPLLERAPATGWPTAVTGTVTRDHALSCLTASIVGLPVEQLDASGLLQWTLDLEGRAAWQSQPDVVRHGIAEWVREVHGDVAALALAIASAVHHVDAVSLGVVADVLWPSGGDVPQAAIEARIRLESFTGVAGLGASVARAWADSSLGVLLRMADEADQVPRASILARATTVFTDLRWAEGAAHSQVLDAGYVHRLRGLAGLVKSAVSDLNRAGEVEAAFASLLAHDQATRDRRTDVARMSIRLVRWLAQPDGEEPTTLRIAVERHVRSDAWVDRAVADVWVGSSDPVVAAAWSALDTAVRARRRDHDRRTALLLADATASGVLPTGLMPVERFVPDVVRPMATERAGVLLIVIDGMSAAVAVEVAEGALASGWLEAVPVDDPRRTGVLAVLPTLTRYSRTSLFAGKLIAGQQSDEKTHFSQATPGSGVVFHKSDLVGSAGEELPGPVLAALSSQIPVVAVVLNTVDDALSKHDPGGTDWDISSIRHLQALLEQAAAADRVVVLTSDHGHVVERGSAVASYDGAEARFRPTVSGPVDPQSEVLLTGPRVLAPGGSVIAAWVEDLRYGNKQAGYHGGASAAEVVIPVIVLARQPDVLELVGWVPAPPQAPAWWNDPVVIAGIVPAPSSTSAGASKTGSRKTHRQINGQESLLPSEPEVTATPVVASTLVPTLLASSTYAQQRARAGTRALDDQRVEAMLTALLAHGGRLHRDTLAGVAGIPVPRISTTLAALRRQINVEGYDVVSLDPDGVSVLLDLVLLREQFDLGDAR